MTAVGLALLAVHAVLVYAWVVFPLLLGIFARGRREPASADSAADTPLVAFVLSAYNEEGHIGRRVGNLLELDYPKARWRAYIGVDGARDRTAEEARQAAAAHDNIFVFDFAENRGKVAVLKDLVERATTGSGTEILGFTDANTVFEKDALRCLCRPFADLAVGGVCGKLRFVRGEGTQTEENVYWRLENWLKARESAIDSCLGANGAIYAIRAPLFWSAIPSNTIIDDFVIGMKVRERNYRVVYEPRALAVEELPANLTDEWKRRVRIGAGDFQALKLCGACLGPSYGMFAWMFWSHKVLRWFTPHLMIAGFLLALLYGIGQAPLGLVLPGLYAALGLAGLFGRWSRTRQGRMAQLLRGTEYLLAMQFAIFAGFLRFCRGNLEGRWQTTARGR